MTKYKIKFITNETLIGDSKQIADQLRASSKFESHLTTRKYMRRLSQRIRFVYGQRVSTWTYDRFIKTLIKTKFVEDYSIIED